MELKEDAVVLAAPLDEVWRFFSLPRNLATLTPGKQGLRVDHGGNRPIEEGAVVLVSVALIPGIRVGWKTVIGEVVPPGAGEMAWFRDVQERGPFAVWDHLHVFRSLSNGETVVLDRVRYALPLGRAGRMVAGRWVRAQVDGLFAYRKSALESLFGRGGEDFQWTGFEWPDLEELRHSPGRDRGGRGRG